MSDENIIIVEDYEIARDISRSDLIDAHRVVSKFNIDLNNKITNLKKQIEILEKSNEFYASDFSWNARNEDESVNDMIAANDISGYIFSGDTLTGGHRARQAKRALKELREGSEE